MTDKFAEPSGLGSAGRKLWAEITTTWELDADELSTLEQACRTADELDALSGALRTAPTVVAGSTGQQRPNPLFNEVRAHRTTLAMLLSRLRVPGESTGNMISDAARDAASKRWKGKARIA